MPEYILENRLRAVMKKLDITQAEMARRLGLAPESLGKYLADSNVKGKRNPEMLVTKLSSIGISLDWYIAGKGTMFLEDVQHKSEEEDDRYAKAGKLLYEAIATLLPSQEMDVRSTVERILKSSPNCCGTGLELTDEEYARLVELRQNAARNRKFTDEHE